MNQVTESRGIRLLASPELTGITSSASMPELGYSTGYPTTLTLTTPAANQLRGRLQFTGGDAAPAVFYYRLVGEAEFTRNGAGEASALSLHVQTVSGLPAGTYEAYYEDGVNYRSELATATIADAVAVNPSGSSMTFAQIETAAAARLEDTDLLFVNAEDWAAEFLLVMPHPYWTVDMVARTVTGENEPEPPANATMLPAPSGGDDTSMLQNAATTGARLVGTGQEYSVNELNITANDVRMWDIPMAARSTSKIVMSIRGDDFRKYRCPIDAKQQAQTRSGVRLYGAQRSHIIKSGFKNARCSVGTSSSDSSGAGFIASEGSNDFHVAMNEYTELTNTSGATGTHRINAFWMIGSGHAGQSGMIAANYVDNTWSLGTLKDSDFLTCQGCTAGQSNGILYVLGNTAIDYGKRFTKNQDSVEIVVRSNNATWTRADTAAVNRGRLCCHSIQPFYVAGSIDSQHNKWHVAVQDNYLGLVAWTVPTGTRRLYKDVKIERNLAVIDSSPTGTFDHMGISMTTHSNADDTGGGSASTINEDSSCSVSYNNFKGAGRLNYAFRCGWGFAFSGPIKKVGNKFQVPTLLGFERTN